MNEIRFNYSLKNIPLPKPDDFRRCMIEKVESLITRMRWKTHFLMSGEDNSKNNSPHFGFKSTKTPPQVQELKPFENDMYKMIETLEFKKVHDPFLTTIQEDIKKIKSSKNVYVFADKTRNLYEMDPPKYNQLLTENNQNLQTGG